MKYFLKDDRKPEVGIFKEFIQRIKSQIFISLFVKEPTTRMSNCKNRLEFVIQSFKNMLRLENRRKQTN